MHWFSHEPDRVPERPAPHPTSRPTLHRDKRGKLRRPARFVAAVSVLSLPMALSIPLLSARAAIAPVSGAGFTVTTADLAFILKQIKIAERHTVTRTAANPCGTLLNNPAGDGIPDAEQVPDILTSYGLRTVDGSCNNLKTGNATLSAADQPFPRLTTPRFAAAESSPPAFGPSHPTSYAQKKGSVFDSQPRVISNLIDDQTSTNPAALAAAAFPVRTQKAGVATAVPCTTDPDPSALPNPIVAVPTGCTPSHSTLFIPNVTTDVGLSPPYNSLFTFFGQFFDHGVDQTVKSGGTVFVPLQPDDPLIAGPDHVLGTTDDLPADKQFMVLTRAQNQPGPDGVIGDRAPTTSPSIACTSLNVPAGCDESMDDVQNANNTDTPWVDQSQTYTSHASHQVFVRKYAASTSATAFGSTNPASVSTGKLLGGLGVGLTYAGSPDGTAGMATWASVKQQAHDLLGLQLVDRDVTDIPMLATDPYGKFIPGPLRGLPQYVTNIRMVEGNLSSPVPVALTPRSVTDGVTTTASTTVSSVLAAFTQDDVGSAVTGTGIPAGATITSVQAADTATLSQAATADGTGVTLTIDPGTVRHFDTPFLTDIAHNADPSPQRDPATGAITVPTPDADSTPSADFASQLAGTYDNEMLDAHFICGDGRCNENIALTTIHQVFHSEHDRLVGYIDNVLSSDTSPTGIAALATWKTVTDTGYNYGERLFQAARFVNEMEYQHTVFEEFARKVQPAVRPFHVYSPDINPAIKAEFAHAVYRFGHSMLDDTVARTNVDLATGAKTDNSIPLLKAFLNPPEFFNGGTSGTLTADAAAGSIVMGSSSQIGNELDEFVVETLRNNLLGLPLDLPTLNMTRAREAGVPPLNDVRRQLFASTNDGQLTPYTSWSDFGQHLKHPESLINFVAAYGTHPTILSANAGPDGIFGNADDAPPTLASRRDAARAIVNPSATDTPPADAADFMFSTGPWASNPDGSTITGLDKVDLWVGGLAEVTNLFGGLLGSTFNYVFENQLENLQDGDRLYYLARTPGLNLRTQLEGNSFAELIQRNTDGTNSLKADAFATADCRFQLANLSGTPAGFTQFGSTVADDLTTTDCDESKLLIRQPNGTIQYRQFNTVDPSGINGQSVYNGSSGNDRVFGGNDNDTFWGGAGNDVIEGNGGDDVALGGDGNDIITDLSGADVLKGGPGNDAIDAGIGNDIVLGGDGADFLNAGANDNETFAGPGNDHIIAGQGADAVFGDGGNDWIQGGTGQDLLQGDHGAPFFDDPGQTAPGNDIMIGQPGENDYDAEGGDDIMAQNAAIDRNAGSGGFDWAIHQYNTIPANDDMMINNNLGGLPIQLIVNRDRWQETEADSGGAFNDVILGTTGVLSVPRLIGGGGFAGCDALDQAGVNRIKGLDALLPPVAQWLGTSAAVAALSAMGQCPLTGPVWGEGDILMGGPGSDTFTGRGGNEIIDGDKSLEVHITVRDPANPATELGRTDLMENKATSGNFGPGTTGMTLQQAVFAGLVDPGNLVDFRELVTAPDAPADCGATAPVNCDTAVFTGPRTNYSIVNTPATGTTLAKVTVTQTGANVALQKISDGSDTLRNIEALKFSDQTVLVTVPNAPTIGTATASSTATTTGTATVTWSGPVANGGPPVTSFTIVATPTTGATVTRTGLPRTALSGTISGLVNGMTYTLQVAAVNLFGTGPLSAPSNAVTPVGLPGAPSGVLAVRGNTSASLTWTAPTSDGGSPITGYNVMVRTGGTLVRTDVLTGTATSTVITGLTNGTAYNFRVQAVNLLGAGPASASSNTVTPATVPDAPASVTATSGALGGNLTVTVNWAAPPSTGGSPITGYIVRAYNSAGVTVQTTPLLSSGTRSRVVNFTTPTNMGAGPWLFDVTAANAVGESLLSARVGPVVAQ